MMSAEPNQSILHPELWKDHKVQPPQMERHTHFPEGRMHAYPESCRVEEDHAHHHDHHHRHRHQHPSTRRMHYQISEGRVFAYPEKRIEDHARSSRGRVVQNHLPDGTMYDASHHRPSPSTGRVHYSYPIIKVEDHPLFPKGRHHSHPVTAMEDDHAFKHHSRLPHLPRQLTRSHDNHKNNYHPKKQSAPQGAITHSRRQETAATVRMMVEEDAEEQPLLDGVHRSRWPHFLRQLTRPHRQHGQPPQKIVTNDISSHSYRNIGVKVGDNENEQTPLPGVSVTDHHSHHPRWPHLPRHLTSSHHKHTHRDSKNESVTNDATSHSRRSIGVMIKDNDDDQSLLQVESRPDDNSDENLHLPLPSHWPSLSKHLSSHNNHHPNAGRATARSVTTTRTVVKPYNPFHGSNNAEPVFAFTSVDVLATKKAYQRVGSN